ncbi:hypothetical protein [Chryseobacterium sp. ERMR1:04]|uniref:hypothetical protein n=1 Tax=Chryseobacterium sp. ERMR1:04 TaxID=1705393 RepID=UPI0006C8B067|nr:hypothetical protein [Chryseobacterium sp. ERMR1:04]
MKQMILIAFLLILSNCDGQNKEKSIHKSITVKNKIPHSIKNDTMEYFNENEYIDWQQDPEHCSSQFPCEENNKFLMKANERVNIFTDTKTFIQVDKSNKINPYKIIKVYSFKSKNLLNISKDFYSFPVSYQKYDENGKLIEEKDYNKPYEFSIKDLVEKIKKEYKVDLEDKREKAFAGRKAKNGSFYYEVSIDMKVPLVTELKYILVDGITGKTLFTSIYYTKGGGEIPFDKYLETLKKK